MGSLNAETNVNEQGFFQPLLRHYREALQIVDGYSSLVTVTNYQNYGHIPPGPPITTKSLTTSQRASLAFPVVKFYILVTNTPR